jgi:Zn finger protein HypA/HybF involved in hydrogenase expression
MIDKTDEVPHYLVDDDPYPSFECECCGSELPSKPRDGYCGHCRSFEKED